MTLLLVVAGGAIGAPLRYYTDRAVQARHDSVFPWGTLIVNVVASLVLGVLVGASVSTEAMALLGIGLCGALSTYSTFSYETLRLLQERSHLLAAANVVVSVTATLGAAALGFLLGDAAWS